MPIRNRERCAEMLAIFEVRTYAVERLKVRGRTVYCPFQHSKFTVGAISESRPSVAAQVLMKCQIRLNMPDTANNETV